MQALKTGAILALLSVFSAFLLSFVHNAMSAKISQFRAEEDFKMKASILPGASIFEVSDEYGNETGFDSNNMEVGKIVHITAEGYNGPIELIAGIQKNGEIMGIKIIRHNESLGTGSNIAGEGFVSQFKNTKTFQLFLKNDNEKGIIDAISGATVSSRNIVNAVREAAGSFVPKEKKENDAEEK